NRLGALQMGIGGHNGVARRFRSRQEKVKQIKKGSVQQGERGTNKQTQGGCDLLVTAATPVEFVAGISDQSGEFPFDEVVDIFGFLILKIGGRSTCFFSDPI